MVQTGRAQPAVIIAKIACLCCYVPFKLNESERVYGIYLIGERKKENILSPLAPDWNLCLISNMCITENKLP